MKIPWLHWQRLEWQFPIVNRDGSELSDEDKNLFSLIFISCITVGLVGFCSGLAIGTFI